jgi:hypothetical protein
MNVTPSRLAISFILGLALAAAAGACTLSTDHTARVTDLVCSVRTDAAAGTYQSGSPPAADSGPPAMVTSPQVLINGGTASATIAAGTGFSRVVLAVDGAQGYYLVTLPSPVGSVDLQLTMCQSIDRPHLDLRYAVGTATSLGAYQAAPADLIEVGTGQLQVSVSWDVESDVDLHVIDPSGDEVYYGQREVASGGMLDLDSNAACDIDHVRNENITWTVAPPGTYRVRLDYFDACQNAVTRYAVTVQRKGQPPQIIMGQLQGDGDTGGKGDGVDITSFTLP